MVSVTLGVPVTGAVGVGVKVPPAVLEGELEGVPEGELEGVEEAVGFKEGVGGAEGEEPGDSEGTPFLLDTVCVAVTRSVLEGVTEAEMEGVEDREVMGVREAEGEGVAEAVGAIELEGLGSPEAEGVVLTEGEGPFVKVGVREGRGEREVEGEEVALPVLLPPPPPPPPPPPCVALPKGVVVGHEDAVDVGV